MKLGIYGGTFDPIHLGHLILAETVREQLGLDELWFVPAFQNPLKQGRPTTPPKARMEMLRFAIAGNPFFRLNDMEIKRKGASFMSETLPAIHEERPDDELFLLIGADSLIDFPNWKAPEVIQDLAQVVAVNRGLDDAVIPESVNADRVTLLNMPAIDISATDIRRRYAEGESIRYLTPRSVELFIEANQLYSSPGTDAVTV